MYVRPEEWYATIEAEYLREFVPRGGAAVKFVVVPRGRPRAAVAERLRDLALAAGCEAPTVDAATVRVHLIDHLFHAVARQLDWDGLTRAVVGGVLARGGYALPPDGRFDYRAVAAANDYDESELRRDVRRLLTAHVYRDFAMAQEFRIAMVRLCQAALEPAAEAADLAETAAIRAWLRGELRLISALKSALIFQKIARHNARDMFLSLAHWLRLAGRRGLVLILDIGRYVEGVRPSDGTLYHSPIAAMDTYEVLRQFIDATDELEACLIAVTVPPEFLDDPKRGLERYDPLKLRIWDEVRDRRRGNPLASLVRFGGEDGAGAGTGGADGADGADGARVPSGRGGAAGPAWGPPAGPGDR